MIAILAMATLFWILESIPIFATSVLIIGVELVAISDRGFILFRQGSGSPEFGTLLNYQSIMATFASPIIMLFMGGFFLAMAATKYRLDINLARILLRPFGSNPKYILLGLIAITGLLSMFMSNTATTAMMLAILTPVLSALDAEDTGRTAFVLAIPFAANIGGIGTPIGTPPNAVALKYLIGANSVSFSQWMAFSVPYALVMLILVWLLLWKLYPVQVSRISVDIQDRFLTNGKAVIVYVTSAGTILLWLTDFLHGMNEYIVAMIPVVVFTVTRIITPADLKRLSWDVLWLVAGGIALGLGLEKTGLSKLLVESIPFGAFSPYVILVIATAVAILMSTLTSNTATANLLLPLVAALGSTLPVLKAVGGDRALIISVAMSCSLAMALPISTPPNAMSHATGMVESKQMVRAGAIIGVVGLFGIYLLVAMLKKMGFL